MTKLESLSNLFGIGLNNKDLIMTMQFSIVESPRLPHLRLPNLMESYAEIHSRVFFTGSEDAEQHVLRRLLDDSYMNYVTEKQGVWDLALILFYRDYVGADSVEKREKLKNTYKNNIPKTVELRFEDLGIEVFRLKKRKE